MSENNSVIVEKRGQAFFIANNGRTKRNALNAEVIAGIARGYRDAHKDKDARLTVLTSAGDKAFCAGADLQNSGAAFSIVFPAPTSITTICCDSRRTQRSQPIARVGGICMAAAWDFSACRPFGRC